jgi:undecaprenyl phosphate N,N'-diacetylbacillosamine 1-phosphate transferase
MLRFFDLLLLILISTLIFPIFLFVFLLALFFHRRNVFFFQQRVGKNKKIFNLIKFRSMIINAQNMGTGLYSYADDNRITFFGKFLRTTSLDELPQLINILKGDMSFVGPRPPVVGELDEELDLPLDVDLRFSIKPGLSGWAQIHGRDNLTWSQKAFFDVEFVKMKGFIKFITIIYILVFTPFYILNFSATYEKRKS